MRAFHKALFVRFVFKKNFEIYKLLKVASLVSLQRLKHPNILQLVLFKMNYFNNPIRLHDAFIRRRDDQISLNILCEKCDWDLADFLLKIPHDMCDAQCKHFASQIFSGIV